MALNGIEEVKACQEQMGEEPQGATRDTFARFRRRLKFRDSIPIGP